MGASGSGSSGVDDLVHGKWEWDTSTCDCDSKYKRITTLSWIECDILNTNVKRLTNVGRVASIGVTEYWAGFEDITHDAVECTVDCCQCGANDQYYTFDYCALGKRYRCGRYTKQYAPKQVIRCKDIKDRNKLSLRYLEQVFVETKPRRKSYHIYRNNCKHFATAFWNIFHDTA